MRIQQLVLLLALLLLTLLGVGQAHARPYDHRTPLIRARANGHNPLRRQVGATVVHAVHGIAHLPSHTVTP